MLDALVVGTAVVVAVLLAWTPALRRSRAWKATVTPLSSIMGSGFLVSAPLVASVSGLWAPLAMGALLLVAYGLGAMIRFNIRFAEPLVEGATSNEHRTHQGHRDGSRGTWALDGRHVAVALEKVSHVVLAGAYVVSVSYYLQLLAAFVLERFGVSDPLWAKLGTTAVLAIITVVGALFGLRALEKVETVAVSSNLGAIVALLVGLIAHVAQQASRGTLTLPELALPDDHLHSARVMMGLLIVVQGFETSRFLGAEHPAEERVTSMRRAQWISAFIYLAFVSLMLPLLSSGMEAEVTAIVRLVAPVATVLPTLLVVAAVGSQFSAAVADDAGCAGLVGTMVSDRVSPRLVYVAIGGLAIGLTWLTDVLAVISLASRAFALFYAFQCAVTVATARRVEDAPRRSAYVVGGTLLALVSLAVTVFGVPAE
ncbi:MAG: hypothetical protein R3B99_29530 [Polyangiales bacterium]|nr:hypothetical protein [Myxococcales bacterium]